MSRRADADGSAPSLGEPPAPARERWVVYVDLDAYYVSCEIRDRPELADRAVIVGPPPEAGVTRGVVLSASYAARRLGIHSAMPAMAAHRLAPDAVWFPPDFVKYEQLAAEVRQMLDRFSDEVIPFSIDEAAVILGSVGASEAGRVAEQIQRSLREELRLPASLGVATSRVVAKIATDRAKPGGIVVVPPERIGSFLAPLPVGTIPGVGPKTEERLDALGVRTIGDLASRRPRDLDRALGGFGRELIALARGHPIEAPVGPVGSRGRSTDRTLPRDATTWSEIEPVVEELAHELGSHLEREGMRYGGVGVAYRWGDFSRSSRGRLLSGASEGPGPMAAAARRLAAELWERGAPGAAQTVRTISVRAERLIPRSQRQTVLDETGTVGPAVK